MKIKDSTLHTNIVCRISKSDLKIIDDHIKWLKVNQYVDTNRSAVLRNYVLHHIKIMESSITNKEKVENMHNISNERRKRGEI